MTGFWLASYIGLWVIVIVLILVLVGILQQLGLLQRQVGQSRTGPTQADEVPSSAQDGPGIGSLLPDLRLVSVNGFGTLTLWESTNTTLLLFMSPMCEGCQKIVDPLNEFIDSRGYTGRAVVILRGDDPACQAFLRVFPLHVPVIQDRDSLITQEVAVHYRPFGLLYDAAGSLRSKRVVVRNDDLSTLLADAMERPNALPVK